MSSLKFTGREVIEMALKIEENGMKFYTDAFKAARDETTKNLFKKLAIEEGHHIKIFSDMKNLVKDEYVTEGFDPYITEASEYLRSMADSEVFSNPGEGGQFAGEISNPGEVLDHAINMEKESLVFYGEYEKVIVEKDKAVLTALIEQEKEHLQTLIDLRKEYS
ncbi:MAG: ferritin family protein [Thermodesulfobacteriota bacterium]